MSYAYGITLYCTVLVQNSTFQKQLMNNEDFWNPKSNRSGSILLNKPYYWVLSSFPTRNMKLSLLALGSWISRRVSTFRELAEDGKASGRFPNGFYWGSVVSSAFLVVSGYYCYELVYFYSFL